MLSPGDLRSPTGDLGDSLFPGESSGKLDERLQGYIDEGYSKASAAALAGDDADEAAKAWSYYRAYNAVYVRMLNNPSTVQMERQGQTSTLWSQIEAMGKLADAAKATFLELLPPESQVGTPTLPETAAVPTQFTY
jgi:hypothetical protein